MMYGALDEVIWESDLFSPTMMNTWPKDGTVAAEAWLAATGLAVSTQAARPRRMGRGRTAAPPVDRAQGGRLPYPDARRMGGGEQSGSRSESRIILPPTFCYDVFAHLNYHVALRPEIAVTVVDVKVALTGCRAGPAPARSPRTAP